MNNEKAYRMATWKRMIRMAIGLGALYWVMTSAVDVFIFREGTLIEEIFTLDPHKVWMRSLVLGSLILLSIYALSIISERKKAEGALRESEKKHRTLVEQSLQGLAVVQDYLVVFANSAAAEITGFTVDELLSMSPQAVREIIHSEDRRLAWDRFRDRMAGETPDSRHEYRLVRKDGTVRWIEMFSASIEYRGKPALQAAFIDITERRLAEERLRESEERYRDLFDNASDLIQSVDEKGKFVYVNKKWKEVLGYSDEEVTNLSLIDILREDQIPHCMSLFNRVMGGKTLDNVEVVFVTKGGKEIFASGSVNPRMKDGEFVATRAIFRDVTERKQAEEAVRVSEERLRQIAENVGEGFFLSDASDNSAIYVSPAYEKIWGRPVEKAYADPQAWLEAVHPEDRERVNAYIDKHGRGKIQFSQEYRIQWPDGTIRWVRDRVYPVKNESGHIGRIVGVTDDITERKRAEDALREANALLNTLVQAIPDVVYVKDYQGRNLLVNRAYEELVNLSQREMIGKYDQQVLPARLAAQCRQSDEEVMKQRQSVRCEELSTTEKGEQVFFETIKAPLLDDQGNLLGLVGVSRDITERKRAEGMLTKAKEQAEEANRLKSQFLANMSHEIRTPMNAIIGMTDIVLDTDLTDEQRDYLSTVKHSARALLELLNDILDLSKIEADKIELETIDFDLRVTVEGVADTLARRASEKGLELACMIHHQVPSRLRGDPGRLRQILMNLAGNAVKFTDRGEVVISVEVEQETEQRAWLVVSVADTGMGISQEKQEKIFESFTQADGSTTRKYGGTGLGLSICKRLVELMGGQIGVQSQPGKGSRFWFKVALEKQQSTDEDFLVIPPDIRGMRMLVVDDNRTNRTILAKMLESFGCSPEVVESGRQALETLKRAVHGEKLFDLVLLDMQMPEMDGVETLKAIKADPDIRDMVVIMLTSMGVRGDAARLEAMGCAGYLLKPVKQSQLFDTIITVLSRRESKLQDTPFKIVTRHTVADVKRRRTRILLAEDNPMNQKLAVALLKKAGYTVDAVENGKLAVEALNRKYYDLVLMDVQMPEMDGFEATKAIREKKDERRNIPILAMTAHAMKGDRERCLGAGMDDYVSKPIEPQELLDAIKKWVRADADEQEGTEAGVRQQSRVCDPIVNIEAVLQNRFDGDIDFFAEMLREFLAYAPKQLENLERSLDASDGRVVESEAHSLKGAAGNLGARRIAELALEMELAGRTGELSTAPVALENLRSELKRVQEYVDKWLGERTDPQAEAARRNQTPAGQT
jgi:two-component system sensor histidine kinase/response regulator